MTAVASCAAGAAAASTSPTISASPARLFLTIDHRLSRLRFCGTRKLRRGKLGASPAVARQRGGGHCKPLRTGRIEYRLRSMTEFKPQQLDQKWQQHWAAAKTFEVDVDGSLPKFYCLEMFAYPSGHALVGH